MDLTRLTNTVDQRIDDPSEPNSSGDEEMDSCSESSWQPDDEVPLGRLMENRPQLVVPDNSTACKRGLSDDSDDEEVKRLKGSALSLGIQALCSILRAF